MNGTSIISATRCSLAILRHSSQVIIHASPYDVSSASSLPQPSDQPEHPKHPPSPQLPRQPPRLLKPHSPWPPSYTIPVPSNVLLPTTRNRPAVIPCELCFSSLHSSSKNIVSIFTRTLVFSAFIVCVRLVVTHTPASPPIRSALT